VPPKSAFFIGEKVILRFLPQSRLEAPVCREISISFTFPLAEPKLRRYDLTHDGDTIHGQPGD